MIVRTALAACLATVLVAPAGTGFAKPLKQVYKKPGPIVPGSYADPYYGRQGNRICPRWCLQDRNPCDPPEFKVADGRCRIDFLDD